jgi:hypothetical protein
MFVRHYPRQKSLNNNLEATWTRKNYEIELKISPVTHNYLEYVYSRQHVSAPLGPSSGLTSIKSRARVEFAVITQRLLL